MSVLSVRSHMSVLGHVVVALVLLTSCSGGPERAASPSSPAVVSSAVVSSTVVSSTSVPVAAVPPGFCDLAVRASGGSVPMDVDVDANELVVFAGLSDRHRAMIRSAVADSARQVRTGGGWDTTTLVDAVNVICGLHLAPVTMTP